MAANHHLSFGDDIPPDQLRSAFGSVSVDLPESPTLAFRIALPKGWKEVRVERKPLEVDRFSVLAAFMASDSLGIQVLGTLVPWEVNLVDWTEYQAFRVGIKLVEVQSADTEWGQAVHAAAEGSDGARLRILVVGDGPRVVMLMGRMADGSDAMAWETLGLAAASFLFSAPSGARTREPVAAYRDPDQFFQVLYPASWTPEHQSRLRPWKSGADFRIVSDTDTLAYLRIEADSREPRDETGLAEVLQNTVEEVAEADVRIEELTPIPPGEGGGERQRWIGRCALPSGEGQVVLLFRPGARAWLAAVLISPAKALNPYVWMRGKRFYEMVVASLLPLRTDDCAASS